MCLINWRLWAIAFSLCSVGQKPQTIRWCRFSKLRKSIVNSQILQIDCGAIMTSRRVFGINPWVACTLVIRLILFPKWILSFWTLNTLEIPISKGILIAMQKNFLRKYCFHYMYIWVSPSSCNIKKKWKNKEEFILVQEFSYTSSFPLRIEKLDWHQASLRCSRTSKYW